MAVNDPMFGRRGMTFQMLEEGFLCTHDLHSAAGHTGQAAQAPGSGDEPCRQHRSRQGGKVWSQLLCRGDNFHLHDLPGFSEALNRFRERAHVFVFTKPFCQILSMNDLLAVQTGPFIQPLIQHIHSLGHIIQGLHGLQQVLLGRGKFQELSVHKFQGHISKARVVFVVICHGAMNKRNAAQIGLQDRNGRETSSLPQEHLDHAVRISSAKKVPRLLVNFSKPGYNLHPLTISGGLE